jgi:hypothetical protein
MNRAEAVAKLVFESIVSTSMTYQLEQSHGECDFESRYRGWWLGRDTLPFPLCGQA